MDRVIEQHGLAGQASLGTGGTLAGDVGLVALKALLENGIGYVVSSFSDRPTLVDAAIDDVRSWLLAPAGVQIRRMRAVTAVAQLIERPVPAVDGAAGTVRGAIVLAGRRGMRPVVEELGAVEVPGPVVVLAHDSDVVRAANTIVIDPAPTMQALVAAIDAAVATSRMAARPVVVVLRERLQTARGAIATRDNVSVAVARAADADAADRGLGAEEAVARAGLVRLHTIGSGDARRVVHVPAWAAAAARDAVAEAVATTHSASADGGVHVIETAVPTLPPLQSDQVQAALADAATVLAIGARGAATGQLVREVARTAVVTDVALDPDTATADDVRAAVLEWYLDAQGGISTARERGAALVARILPPGAQIPRRDETLHRALPTTVAAALELAQGVLGVPSRPHPDHPTYDTPDGASLTIVTPAQLRAQGAQIAAPHARQAGTWLVAGPGTGGSDVLDAAAALGGTVELLEEDRVRSVGAAIARACRAQRSAPHIIIATPVQRVAGSSPAAVGVDHDLLGTERLALAPLPTAATVEAETGDELERGPARLVPDSPAARAAAAEVQQLTGALHRVSIVSRAGASRMADVRWSARRRTLRALLGVDA